MSIIVKDLLVSARKLNYYIEDATDVAAGNLKFDSTTLQKYLPSTGYRWFFLWGVVYRDVSSTCEIDIRDSSDKIIGHLATLSAATGVASYPGALGTACHQVPTWFVLDPGDYINIAFGTAQGAGAYASCVVLEVQI